MSKRLWAMILIGIMALLISGGCAKREESKIKIKFIYPASGGQNEIESYNLTIKKFEEKFPEIDILPEMISLDYERKMMTMIASGLSPDIIWVPGKTFLQYCEKGIFLPIDDFVKKDKFDLGDFFDLCLEEYTYRGKLYGLSKGWGCDVIYYNKELFDRAQIDYPKDNWTWGECLDTAKKLTLDFDKNGRLDQYGFDPQVKNFSSSFAWIWSNGGEILNEKKTQCLLNSPQAIEALQFFLNFKTAYHVTPSYEKSGQDLPELFYTGKIAMAGSNSFLRGLIRKYAPSIRWGVVYYPARQRRATRYFGDGYCISSQTRYPEECWKFLKFLTKEGMETEAKLTSLYIPSRKSIANSKLFCISENEEKMIKAAKFARHEPINPKFKETKEAMQRYWDLVVIGELTVKKGTEKMTGEINSLLKEK